MYERHIIHMCIAAFKPSCVILSVLTDCQLCTMSSKSPEQPKIHQALLSGAAKKQKGKAAAKAASSPPAAKKQKGKAAAKAASSTPAAATPPAAVGSDEEALIALVKKKPAAAKKVFITLVLRVMRDVLYMWG